MTYKWDTPANVRKSIRMICDEEGLPIVRTNNIGGKMYLDKDIICAVIQCESGFDTKRTNKNKDGTTDWGLCQYNDYWYIGKGKPIASIDEAMNNPEKCVRVMIQQYKKGRIKDWVCYSGNFYKKYL